MCVNVDEGMSIEMFINCRTVARLQFRLPDGSTRTRQFPATDKLSVVSSFLNDVCRLAVETIY